MGLVVQKFGGSSVKSTEKLFNICKYITKEFDNNNKNEVRDKLIKLIYNTSLFINYILFLIFLIA